MATWDADAAAKKADGAEALKTAAAAAALAAVAYLVWIFDAEAKKWSI